MRVLWVENHAAFVRVAGRQFLAAHNLTVVPSVAGSVAALAAGADAACPKMRFADIEGVLRSAVAGRSEPGAGA